MSSENFLLIKEAIENKFQIHADYQGHHREMSPHLLGYKNGYEERALFVQFGGRSSKGVITPETREWRCMNVADLRHVQIVEGPFYDIAAGKNQKPANCVDQIVAVVR